MKSSLCSIPEHRAYTAGAMRRNAATGCAAVAGLLLAGTLGPGAEDAGRDDHQKSDRDLIGSALVHGLFSFGIDLAGGDVEHVAPCVTRAGACRKTRAKVAGRRPDVPPVVFALGTTVSQMRGSRRDSNWSEKTRLFVSRGRLGGRG